MANRQYEAFTLFNVRITDMRHLWTPSDTYKGQKQQKANYFAGFIVPKTQAQWHLEPALAGLVQALGKLHQNNPQIVDWRIEDGDTPNAEGKSSEFAKGHWLFNGSSGNPINVELVQAGGQLVKLQNKVGVKSGDFCMVGGTVAVSGQNNRAAKVYLNAVVFTAPGEEIVFANSVSGAELMNAAAAQGFRPTGFSPSPGGFGGQPQGFAPQGPGLNAQPNFGGAPTPAFAAPNSGGFVPQGAGLGVPNPGFTPGAAPGALTNPGGFAPQGTAPSGPGFGGGAASPFNPGAGGFPQGGGGPFGQR
jgi:hypothetical protein